MACKVLRHKRKETTNTKKYTSYFWKKKTNTKNFWIIFKHCVEFLVLHELQFYLNHTDIAECSGSIKSLSKTWTKKFGQMLWACQNRSHSSIDAMPCRLIKLMNFIIIAEQILPLLRTRQGSQKALYINRFQAHLEDDSRWDENIYIYIYT